MIINENIMSVNEYVDLMIESKREYIVLESSNKEMLDMYKHHGKMIKAYIKAAKEKKNEKLYKQSKQDFEKALAEINAMEKSIREMDSTAMEAASSILAQVILITFGYILMEGLRYMSDKHWSENKKHDTDYKSFLSDDIEDYIGPKTEYEQDRYNNAIAIAKHNIEIFNKIDQGNKIWKVANIAITSGIALYKAIKIVINAKKEIKKGESAPNAFNQYKISILKSCEECKKFVQTEIKFIQTVIDSDERN